MRTLTRRSLLLSTAAATFAATAAPCFAATGTPFKPWQAEIDAVFEFFDEHHFTPEERQRALYLRPLHTEADGLAVRDVLEFKLARSAYTQERVDVLLSIKYIMTHQHGTDLHAQRQHLNHRWSDTPRVSVRHLMTTGSRDDLCTALLCAQARV